MSTKRTHSESKETDPMIRSEKCLNKLFDALVDIDDSIRGLEDLTRLKQIDCVGTLYEIDVKLAISHLTGICELTERIVKTHRAVQAEKKAKSHKQAAATEK
jgi:hypothetical protein